MSTRTGSLEEGHHPPGRRSFWRRCLLAARTHQLTPRSSPRRELLAFAVALVLIRALFLLAALDPQEDRVVTSLSAAGLEWTDVPDQPLYGREELYAGAAAEALRHGAGLPLCVYRFMPYGSGSLWISVATVPLFTLFGPYFHVLKILGLLTSLAAGVFWFLTVRRWLGRRAARGFALLYLFAPGLLLRTLLISKGDHGEAAAWIGASLYLATCAAQEGSPPRRRLLAAATGVLAGLGVSMTYSTVPILGALGLAALLLTRARPREAWIGFALGLAAGLLPWLSTIVETHGQALHVYGRPLLSIGSASLIGLKLRLLFNRGLLAAFDLPGPPIVRLLSGHLWLVIVLLGWARALRLWKEWPARLLLVGTIAHLAAFCLLAPDPSPRYLAPGYALFLVAAILPLRPQDPERRSFLRLVPVGVGCALGCAAQFSVLLKSDYPTLRAPLRGVDWAIFGEVAGPKPRPDRLPAVRPEIRPYLWIGQGRRALYQLPPREWHQAAGAAGPDSSRFWKGMAIGITDLGLFRERQYAEVDSVFSFLTDAERRLLCDGLEFYPEEVFGPALAGRDLAGIREILQVVPKDEVNRFRGFLARSLAMIILHGPSIPFSEQEAVDLAGGQDRLTEALGWASYRGLSRAGGVRTWPAPGDGWVSDLLVRQRGSEPFLRGLALSYAMDLNTRASSWIIGGRDGPRALGLDVGRATHGLGERDAGFFYAAAGEAAAEALAQPYSGNRWSISTWPWRQAIPGVYQEAFERGLSVSADRSLGLPPSVLP